MSNARHTPGPWTLVAREVLEDGSVYPTHITGGPREVQVCVLETTLLAQLAHEDAEQRSERRRGVYEEDARLIAAAPDLLEALIAVVSVADRATDEFDKARAAIAKATAQS
jgi:hypothetical protein